LTIVVLFYKVKYHTTIDLSVTWKKTRRREEDAATGRRRGDVEDDAETRD
jgi:hypothetical protein